MQIVLYSDDISLLTHWEAALDAEAFQSVDDVEALKTLDNKLIILNYSSCKKECAVLLPLLREQRNNVLVLDRVPELQKAKWLLKYGAMGYGNALMQAHFIRSAVNALREGMVWLHPELTSQLILELPQSEQNHTEELLQKLTAREKETALLLKEGLTYNEIAQRLEIAPRTVKAHAQGIYKKLNISDRIGLALLLK